MELSEAIKVRRSVRHFEERAVEEEKIRSVLESAVWAPSGGNQQNWRFLVVRDKAKLRKYAQIIERTYRELVEKFGDERLRAKLEGSIFGYTLFKDAPVLIVVVATAYHSTSATLSAKKRGEPVKNGITVAGISGVAAAIQNLLLKAHELGLGACWMTSCLVAEGELEEVLGIEPPDRLAAFVPLGYPAGEPPQPKPRKEGVIEFLD